LAVVFEFGFVPGVPEGLVPLPIVPEVPELVVPEPEVEPGLLLPVAPPLPALAPPPAPPAPPPPLPPPPCANAAALNRSAEISATGKSRVRNIVVSLLVAYWGKPRAADGSLRASVYANEEAFAPAVDPLCGSTVCELRGCPGRPNTVVLPIFFVLLLRVADADFTETDAAG
jgi:hypothetical protein